MGRKAAQAFIAALISSTALAQQYEATLIQPQLLGSPQSMTALNLGDDATRSVNLGFTFDYYGQSFTSAWVSSNGFVSFQGPNNLCCDGMPIAQAQRNTIYAYWTDLIGGANPYFRTDGSLALFGWYGTNEYGTNNKNTFEIALSATGSIQINYGAVANTYHMVAAGITGPNATDNIALFYGNNVQNLSNQSGMLAVPPPPPPPPPPPGIDPTPTVEPVQTATVEVAQEEPVQATAAVTETSVEQLVVASSASVESVVREPAQETVSTAAVEVQKEERLSPSEVASLAVGPSAVQQNQEVASQPSEQVASEVVSSESSHSEQQTKASQAQTSLLSTEVSKDVNIETFQREAVQDASTFVRDTVMVVSVQNVNSLVQAEAENVETFGAQTSTEPVGESYVLIPSSGPTFDVYPTTGMGTQPASDWTDGQPDTPLTVSTSVQTADTSPASQAQQLEILNMGNMQTEMAAGPAVDVGDVNAGDAETMTQLAAVPVGYSAYTQARIPDMPFYKPRDIYVAHRIPDANVALYRMMRGQDQRWQEMVDAQYE